MELKVDVHEEKIYPILDRLNLSYTKEALLVGDIVSGNVCIERKTIFDFISSVYSQRIFVQAMNMQANYEHNFIIISGTMHEAYTTFDFKEPVFFGAIASLVINYHVNILWVEDDKCLVRLALKLIEKAENPGSHSIKRIRRSDADVYLSMLCCVPHINAKRAKAIKEKFSLWQLFSVEEKELMQVEGIGKHLARNIKKYFTQIPVC